jgi:hypothetical protein
MNWQARYLGEWFRLMPPQATQPSSLEPTTFADPQDG